MSQPPPPDSTDDLQFTNVEPATPKASPAQICVLCHQPITSEYFAVGDKILCPACRARVQAAPSGNGFARFVKATFMGLGAGLIGALIWFSVRRIGHVEIGLIAVLVGFMVGKAVRKGSGNRGGIGYQILAVVLTYCCIAANYMPDVFEVVYKDFNQRYSTTAPSRAQNTTITTARSHSAGRRAIAIVLLVILVFVVSLAAPFLAGMQNLIGLLIISFALWEAWKFNKHRPIPITGPYQIGTPPPPRRAVPGVIV
jgi:hypothetical protein